MARNAVNCTLVVILCCAIRKAEGQSFADVKRLKDTLLDYDTFDETIRPVESQLDNVTVNIELHLLAIHGLDEVQESMKTTGILQLFWIDDNLKWNVDNFSGIAFITFPQDLIWKPDLALKNSLESYKVLGDKSLNVHVSNAGTVVWTPLEVFLSTCAIDITNFPNDVQTCAMSFVTWSYSDIEVSLVGPSNRGIYLAQYETNSGWDILATQWYIGEHIANEVVFEIKLKRKPSYSMLTLVFPIIILSVLNLFVFILPCGSGEKSGYAITVFLAFTVFLTILESSFPHNSETTSYFAILVFFGTVQSTVITIVTLFMVRFSSYGDETRAPSWLIAFVRFTKCKALREGFNRKCNKTGKILPVTQGNAGPQNANVTDTDGGMDGDKSQTERQDFTWQYCIDGLDAVFFCFFTSTCLAAVLYFFIQIK